MSERSPAGGGVRPRELTADAGWTHYVYGGRRLTTMAGWTRLAQR